MKKLSRFQRGILKAALDYHDRGFCVLPIPLGSKGFGPEWKQYQKVRPTWKQVEKWFSDGFDHNIRLVCGAVSGNFFVLDYDDEPSYKRFLERNPGIEEKTPIVRSGRIEPSPGHHVWLRGKEPIKSAGIVEVRSEGKYVLAPPSVHPITGKAYHFINLEIRELMVIDNLKEIGIDVEPKPRVAVSSGRLFLTPETLRPRKFRELVSHGGRHARALEASRYFFHHYRKDIAEERTVSWAHEFCEGFPDKGFPEKDLTRIIESAYIFLTGGRT